MIKHEVKLDRATGANIEEAQALIPDDADMLEVARIFQALSDLTRSKILLSLTRHELCVTDLATLVGASTSCVSHHLKGLRNLHLVKSRREGNNIFYSIDDAHVGNLFREAFYHLDHVRRKLPDHRPVEATR